MIIDAHVHIGTAGMPGQSISFEEAIGLADKTGVDKLFCTHATSTSYDFEEGDPLVYQAMKKYPNRILGYVSVNSPRHGKRLLDHFKKYIFDYGFHGLKILSFYKSVFLDRADPWMQITDPYAYPLFEMASEWKVPVLAHATPDECDEVCTRFPNLRIMMAHMGATQSANGDWHKGIITAKKHSNLYLDTTSSSMDLGMVEEAVKAIGPKRVVWGSDLPLMEQWYEMEKIRCAEIDEESKKLILGENINRLVSEIKCK